MGWGLLKGLGQGLSETADVYKDVMAYEQQDRQFKDQAKRSQQGIDIQLQKMEAMRKQHLNSIAGYTKTGAPVTQEDVESGYKDPLYSQKSSPKEESYLLDGKEVRAYPGEQPEGARSKEGILLQKGAKELDAKPPVEYVDVIDPKTMVTSRVDKQNVPKGFITINSYSDLKGKGSEALKPVDLSRIMADIKKTLVNEKGKPISIGQEYNGYPPSTITGPGIGLLNESLKKASQNGFRVEVFKDNNTFEKILPGKYDKDVQKWRVVQDIQVDSAPQAQNASPSNRGEVEIPPGFSLPKGVSLKPTDKILNNEQTGESAIWRDGQLIQLDRQSQPKKDQQASHLKQPPVGDMVSHAQTIQTKNTQETNITDPSQWDVSNKKDIPDQLSASADSFKPLVGLLKGGVDAAEDQFKNIVVPAAQTANDMFVNKPLKGMVGLGKSAVNASKEGIEKYQKSVTDEKLYIKENGTQREMTPKEMKMLLSSMESKINGGGKLTEKEKTTYRTLLLIVGDRKKTSKVAG